MKSLLLNFFFGLFPAIALAWSVAADERKPAIERVVSTSVDRRQQNTIFALVYGLWAATLAMWNWMRGEWRGWTVLWLVLAAGALLLCRFLAIRARRDV